MFESLVLYSGFLGSLAGIGMVAKPVRRPGSSWRLRGVVLGATGMALIALGMFLPAAETHAAHPRTELDRITPVWQFSEHHVTRIAAPPDRVFQAIRDVTANEIALFSTLTWIRRFGRSGPESVANAPEHQPLLDVALRGGFVKLAEVQSREIVIGTVVLAPVESRGKIPTPESFAALRDRPGFALATMNFRLDSLGTGTTTLTTETRVFATDPPSVRAFARYWRVIYPGSAMIRRMWLRAIERRAEDPARRG